MHRAQRGRRLHRGFTLVALDLVGDAKLLQHTQDALRARVVEVMDDDHSVSHFSSPVIRGRAGRGKATTWAFDLQRSEAFALLSPSGPAGHLPRMTGEEG